MSGVTERVLPALPYDHEWRYTPRGRVSHAVHADGVARCGAVAVRDPDDWHGGGSQDEHERLMLLPCCVRCCRMLGIDDRLRCPSCHQLMPDGPYEGTVICEGCVLDAFGELG
jgi:hypothetical protein